MGESLELRASALGRRHHLHDLGEQRGLADARRARGAVAVAEYMRPFQECAVPRHFPERLLIDEMIVDSVLFTGAHGAGSGRDGHADMAFRIQQLSRYCGLPCAGRGGENETRSEEHTYELHAQMRIMYAV